MKQHWHPRNENSVLAIIFNHNFETTEFGTPKEFEKKEAGSTQKEISTKKVAETPSFVQDR